MNTLTDLLAIRAATQHDIARVCALNWYFVNAYNTNALEYGFIKNHFTEQHVQTLIAANRIVVAMHEKELAGYYLANDIIDTPEAVERKVTIARLIQLKDLPPGRYSCITQAAIAPRFQGKGIGKRLLKELKVRVAPHLDYLVGYIDRNNHNAFEAHTRSGWQLIGEDEKRYIAYTSTALSH